LRPGYALLTAARFLRRSGRATWALSLMLSLSVAALIFLTATAVGVNQAMVASSVGLFSGHLTAGPLPENFKPADLADADVAAVLKRRYAPGLLFAGERVAAVQLVAVEPASERRHAALFKRIQVLPQAGEVVLGASLAHALGLKPGDRLEFAAGLSAPRQPLRLAGSYATGIEHLDQSLAFTDGRGWDGPWVAAIFLKDAASQPQVLAGYRQRWPSLRFSTWQQQMPDLEQLIELNYVSMNLVIGLVFGVTGLGVAAAFVIFILKNLREYGMLRAAGLSGFETGTLIWLQVVLLNLVASGLGLGLGGAVTLLAARHGIDLSAFTSHNRYFAVSGVIYPSLNRYAVLAPPLCALSLSLLAGLWPAAMAAFRSSSELIRGLTR